MQISTHLVQSLLWAQIQLCDCVMLYSLPVIFPDTLGFWNSIQISTKKKKKRKLQSKNIWKSRSRYTQKTRCMCTAEVVATDIFLDDSTAQSSLRGNIATLSLYGFGFVPSLLAGSFPRQLASALLQGPQSRDSSLTDRPCIQAQTIGLASVSCLAFKTPPLTPMSWEKWRTWQAQSPGSHWASFQSPWVSAGVRCQWGAPG